jgi:acetyl-CoA synthetase (ADP-forming)
VFTAPEDAIRALALARDFRHEVPPEPSLAPGLLDQPVIRAILDRARAARRPVLLDEGLAILKAAGLPVPEHRVVSSVEEAVAAATELRRPVALKLIAAGASHKTDVGGVQLNLEGAEAVRRGFTDLLQAAGRAGVPEPRRVLLQSMVERGRELILGARQDPNFGGVVLVGLGGIFVEVFKDVIMRVVPFSAGEAEQMISRLKAYPILAGARGQTRRDLASIRDGLLAVARLVAAFPEIRELDINPLMVLGEGKGAWAVDARIVL